MFESGLRAHLEAEESLIFPAFRLVYPAESAAVSADHGRFRATLDQLGIVVDLYTIRAEAAREFVETLKTHAQREDDCMYPWAEAHLDEGAYRYLPERLLPTSHRLAPR
jgi:hemerythrin-like domain-containing protein